MRTKLVATLGVLALLATVPALAHHSFSAEYDQSKTVTLTGKMVNFEWVNPHSWIHVDVKETDGKVTKWMIEGGSPNALIRRGVTSQLLKVGMEVSVEGYQAKDGSNRANGRDITLADGRKLSVGSSGTGAPGEQ